jgi:hypothetical protein
MNEAGKGRDTAERAKALFDDSVERLDAATLSRLNRGRQRALEELDRGRRFGSWLRWVPATGVAAAAVLTVMVMNDPAVPLPEGSMSVIDFELLMEDDSLEMLEDLEFLLWLETADTDTNGNVG